MNTIYVYAGGQILHAPKLSKNEYFEHVSADLNNSFVIMQHIRLFKEISREDCTHLLMQKPFCEKTHTTRHSHSRAPVAFILIIN